MQYSPLSIDLPLFAGCHSLFLQEKLAALPQLQLLASVGKVVWCATKLF